MSPLSASVGSILTFAPVVARSSLDSFFDDASRRLAVRAARRVFPKTPTVGSGCHEGRRRVKKEENARKYDADEEAHLSVPSDFIL